MAVMASLYLDDLPAGSASFSGKRLEERPRRISFCNARNESRTGGPPSRKQREKDGAPRCSYEKGQASSQRIYSTFRQLSCDRGLALGFPGKKVGALPFSRSLREGGACSNPRISKWPVVFVRHSGSSHRDVI